MSFLYKVRKLSNDTHKYFLVGLSCYCRLHLLILWFPDFLWLSLVSLVFLSKVSPGTRKKIKYLIANLLFVTCVRISYIIESIQFVDHIDLLSAVFVYL